MIDHVLRPAEPGDRGFIVDSWLRSMRDRTMGSEWARRIPKDSFFSRYGYQGFVEDVLDGAYSSLLLVSALPTDVGFIHGWSAWTILPGNVACLDYLYVRSDYRGATGVAESLLALDETRAPVMERVVSAETVNWKKLAARRGLDWRFEHPYKRKDKR